MSSSLEDFKKRQEELKAYRALSAEDKVAYNREKVEAELTRLQVPFTQEMSIKEIRALLKEKQIKLGCAQGSEYCLECGLSEIERFS